MVFLGWWIGLFGWCLVVFCWCFYRQHKGLLVIARCVANKVWGSDVGERGSDI